MLPPSTIPISSPPLKALKAKDPGYKDQAPLFRRSIELCEKLTAKDEKLFENLWRPLAYLFNWSW